MGRKIGWMAISIALLFSAACSLYRNDRCWLSDTKYQSAREYFVQSGSLDLTERHLKKDLEWRRCEINEAIYRLGKEFQVLPEELPASAQPDLTQPSAPAE